MRQQQHLNCRSDNHLERRNSTPTCQWAERMSQISAQLILLGARWWARRGRGRKFGAIAMLRPYHAPPASRSCDRIRRVTAMLSHNHDPPTASRSRTPQNPDFCGFRYIQKICKMAKAKLANLASRVVTSTGCYTRLENRARQSTTFTVS